MRAARTGAHSVMGSQLLGAHGSHRPTMYYLVVALLCLLAGPLLNFGPTSIGAGSGSGSGSGSHGWMVAAEQTEFEFEFPATDAFVENGHIIVDVPTTPLETLWLAKPQKTLEEKRAFLTAFQLAAAISQDIDEGYQKSLLPGHAALERWGMTQSHLEQMAEAELTAWQEESKMTGHSFVEVASLHSAEAETEITARYEHMTEEQIMMEVEAEVEWPKFISNAVKRAKSAVKSVVNKAKSVAKKVSSVAKKVGGAIRAKAAKVGAGLKKGLKRVGAGIKKVGAGIKKGFRKVGAGMRKVGAGIKKGLRKVGAGMRKVGAGLKKGLKRVGAGIKKVGAGIKKGLKKVGAGLKKAGKAYVNGWKKIGAGLKRAGSAIGRGLKKVGKAVNAGIQLANKAVNVVGKGLDYLEKGIGKGLKFVTKVTGTQFLDGAIDAGLSAAFRMGPLGTFRAVQAGLNTVAAVSQGLTDGGLKGAWNAGKSAVISAAKDYVMSKIPAGKILQKAMSGPLGNMVKTMGKSVLNSPAAKGLLAKAQKGMAVKLMQSPMAKGLVKKLNEKSGELIASGKEKALGYLNDKIQEKTGVDLNLGALAGGGKGGKAGKFDFSGKNLAKVAKTAVKDIAKDAAGRFAEDMRAKGQATLDAQAIARGEQPGPASSLDSLSGLGGRIKGGLGSMRDRANRASKSSGGTSSGGASAAGGSSGGGGSSSSTKSSGGSSGRVYDRDANGRFAKKGTGDLTKSAQGGGGRGSSSGSSTSGDASGSAKSSGGSSGRVYDREANGRFAKKGTGDLTKSANGGRNSGDGSGGTPAPAPKLAPGVTSPGGRRVVSDADFISSRAKAMLAGGGATIADAARAGLQDLGGDDSAGGEGAAAEDDSGGGEEAGAVEDDSEE